MPEAERGSLHLIDKNSNLPNAAPEPLRFDRRGHSSVDPAASTCPDG